MMILSTVACGQTTLENTLKQFSGDDARGYIQPFADLFGANMNSGFYHSAAIPNTGFHIAFDIVAMGSLVGDEQKTYSANTPAGFTPSTFQTATVFGGQGTLVKNSTDTVFQYKGSDGIINTSIFPAAVPQLSIGTIFGTKAVIRYIKTPKLGSDQIPEVTLFGIGAQHSVSRYIPRLPLDLSAGVYYSSFKVGEIMDFTGLSIGAQASKSFAIATLYGGLAWEKTSMTLEYRTTDPLADPQVKQDLDGKNSFRFTLGAGLKFGFFSIFADANFGSITIFSGGIGFGN
ncbi:MAG: hypothetical protein OEM41_01490 [Ignavibacteria bacterium]|nr:hypothetical protein [Ignavibacteria bacterium]